jgi:nitrilase
MAPSGSRPPTPLKVAVVQPEGCPFQTPRALEALARTTAEVAERGAQLVLFPEAYLGGYPWGLRFGTAVGGRTEGGKDLFRRYWESAVVLPPPGTRPGPDTPEALTLSTVASTHGVHLAVGVIERLPGLASTLYCTLVLFGPGGELLSLHRKLKPTAAERLVWGEGDGSTLPVVETPQGRIGGLICWENYMPLARMALYGKGVEIYLAPTADARDRWQSTLRHIAVEGRCFVLGCNQYVTLEHYPPELLAHPEVAAELEAMTAGRGSLLSPGGSSVYGPDGTLLAGPLLGEAGVLEVELDLGLLARERLEFDVVGHYARPDVFQLTVDERPRLPISVIREEPA